MTGGSGRVVDADGHVLEPADTWVKYLEPSCREAGGLMSYGPSLAVLQQRVALFADQLIE